MLCLRVGCWVWKILSRGWSVRFIGVLVWLSVVVLLLFVLWVRWMKYLFGKNCKFLKISFFN